MHYLKSKSMWYQVMCNIQHQDFVPRVAESSRRETLRGLNYELNEQWINALYLDMLERGSDSISVTELVQLESIAKSCPAIAGTAVYKARTIYANMHPGVEFNDLTICNNAGVYKNGNSLFDEENKLLESLASSKSKGNLNENIRNIRVFPNPTDEFVTIEYKLENNESANIVIFDLLGRERIKSSLSSSSYSMVIDVSKLETGIYTYRFIVNNKETYVGKILVE